MVSQDSVVATLAAALGAHDAWLAAGRPGELLTLGGDPDPLAVRLDLRPWGRDRALLGADGASGHAPRGDLFPALNPLPCQRLRPPITFAPPWPTSPRTCATPR